MVETERNHGASPRLASVRRHGYNPTERLPGSKVCPGRPYGAVCADKQGIVSSLVKSEILYDEFVRIIISLSMILFLRQKW